ncbi:MAG: lipopolysaccharide biosynthesis protein [Actinomycetota bacterium]|nr:lipopolysaccharide biosynthesis protein [Actinomycetota bacterium]
MNDEQARHLHVVPTEPEEPLALAIAEDTAGVIGVDPLEPQVSSSQPEPPGAPHMGVAEVKRLAVRGVAALAIRTVGVRMMTFTGNVLLARLLAPKTFGLFAIVNFIVAIASFLADLGIGAALIQRREELTEEDMRTAFTLGLFIDTAFTAAIFLLAPVLVHLYHLDSRYVLAIRVLSMTIMFSTFGTIPSIKLERKLQFTRASMADVASQLVYTAIAVTLAFKGLHVWAFVIASITSRALDAVLLNVMAFWRPRIGFTKASAKRLLVFGLPYQATGLIVQIKDNFVPTFIAFAGGATAVGYLNWAVGLAATPLFLVTIVSRITFPTYARLQHELEELKDAIEQSIRWISATVFPGVFMIMALASPIVHNLYGDKWRPALPAFYFLCIPIMASSYSTVIVSALYGLGRAKQVLRLTIIWTIAGWGLGVPMTLAWGFTGFAAALAIVSSLSLLAVYEIRKVIDLRFARMQIRLMAMAALPSLGVWIAAPRVVHSVATLGAVGIAGGCVYVFILFITGEIGDARRLLKETVRARIGEPEVTPGA